MGPQEEDPADDLGGEGVADADGVREDEVALELLELVRFDPRVLELSEARIHSIDRGPAPEDVLDRGAGPADPSAGRSTQPDGFAAANDAQESFQREISVEFDHVTSEAVPLYCRTAPLTRLPDRSNVRDRNFVRTRRLS